MHADSSTLDEGFGHWLAGFTDGEGCFTIQRVAQLNLASYVCRFTIGLRADDKPTLEEIMRRTGLGEIIDRKPSKIPGHAGNAGAAYTVSRKVEVMALVRIFDRFPLRAKKANDFTIWREAVSEWARCTDRRGGFDWSRMASLKVALQEGRKFESPTVPLPFRLESPTLWPVG